MLIVPNRNSGLVLSAALYQRFTSRGEYDFAARILSAMRFEFGGQVERPADK